MKSIVAYKRFEPEKKENLTKAVEQAMKLAKWKSYVKGSSVFLKVNALSPKVVPGQNTSPWVIEAVADLLSREGFKIFIGDANVATAKQVEQSAKNWGYNNLCKKYNTKFVNLSKQKTVPIRVRGKMFKTLSIPKILTDVDSMVTLPVVKTHNVSGMTCALKNQWGCIPRFRQKYHLMLNQAIPEINLAVPVKFCVADATVCLEDNGPVTGIPKITNSVFASRDRVALDSAVAEFIGYSEAEFKYIAYAEEIGLGLRDYELVGDEMVTYKFRPALASNHPIVSWELKLRKIPVLSKILFETPVFKIPAWFAFKYNSFVWYNKFGAKYARALMKNNDFYRQEFGRLIR